MLAGIAKVASESRVMKLMMMSMNLCRDPPFLFVISQSVLPFMYVSIVISMNESRVMKDIYIATDENVWRESEKNVCTEKYQTIQRSTQREDAPW